MTTTSADLCRQAAELVDSARAQDYGDKRENHENIARQWNAWLHPRLGNKPLTAFDVAMMMSELKVARMKAGKFKLDNHIDHLGYAAIAGELAAGDQPVDLPPPPAPSSDTNETSGP